MLPSWETGGIGVILGLLVSWIWRRLDKNEKQRRAAERTYDGKPNKP